MGRRNYLIEGVSCSGKTSVCHELARRGYHAINGDVDLAYWGNPLSGLPVADQSVEERAWLWDIDKVSALVADPAHELSFFCGGSRNSDRFIELLDCVFVLEIDLSTLNHRLALRPDDEWSGSATEGAAFARLQQATNKGIPGRATAIDACVPVVKVVDAILEHTDRRSL